jgi:hypothetical protein
MIQIAALHSRLEKQPTDLRRNPRDLGDGALASRDMRKLFLIVLAILAGAFLTANQSPAGVQVSIGIPGPVYYGPGYYYGPDYYYGSGYYYPSGYYWGPSGYVYYYHPRWRHRYWRYRHWWYY